MKMAIPDVDGDEPGVLSAALARMRQVVTQHGLGGSLRLVAARAGRLAYLRESHVWYGLDLHAGGPRIDMPPGIRLIRAGVGQVGLLEQLPTVSAGEARRRLGDGADLWMALERDRAVFACWSFRDRMPACADHRESFDLPAGVIGLDDAVTSPSERGRHIAPASWSAIVRELGRGGARAVLTRVEETNVSCRRAIETVGFRAVASMEFERIGGWCSLDVQSYETDGVGAFLAARLGREAQHG